MALFGFLESVCATLQVCEPKPPASIKLKNVHVDAASVLNDVQGALGSEMHRAAAFNQVGDIRYLRRCEGRDVDLTDLQGRTPLMLACKYGQLQAAQELVRHGASLEVLSNSHETASDFAYSARQSEVCCWLETIGMSRSKLQVLQGAAQAYRHGKTYQHGTAYQYAKVNPTETWGASSLAWASSMGYEHPGASLPTSQAVESKTVPDVCAGD